MKMFSSVYWIMRASGIGILAVGSMSSLLLPRALDSSFQSHWEGKRVYLLIPRDQGDKKGFTKTTHLEFLTGRSDSYTRMITSINGEVGFELFSVARVKCTSKGYHIKLSRPVYPDEPVFGFTVSVILDIREGELPLTPQSASDILASVLIEEREFPRLLWIGEGPYKKAAATINLAWLNHIDSIRPGMMTSQLTPLLGPSLDVRSVRIGEDDYLYCWFFEYHFLVISRNGQVIDSSIVYF